MDLRKREREIVGAELKHRFLTKMIAGDEKQKLVTRDEISAIAELGTTEGLLKKRESRIMRNLLKLDSITVADVMTPRTVVIAFQETKTLAEIADEVRELPVSRIPVFNERRDHVSGFVLKTDPLSAIAADDFDRPLTDFVHEIDIDHQCDMGTSVQQLVERLGDRRFFFDGLALVYRSSRLSLIYTTAMFMFTVTGWARERPS